VLRQSSTGQLILQKGGAQLTGALSAGEVRQVASQFSLPAGTAPGVKAEISKNLLHAYSIGFSATLNHLMIIAAVVAFVGSVGGYVLVRQRDFVVPTGPGAPPAAHG
jgi:hypothetical protein